MIIHQVRVNKLHMCPVPLESAHIGHSCTRMCIHGRPSEIERVFEKHALILITLLVLLVLVLAFDLLMALPLVST